MWPIIVLLIAAAVGVPWLLAWERKQARTWTVIAEGEFDRVETRTHRYSTRSGSMVHTTTHHVVKISSVHFADGTCVDCWGRMVPPWPKGTHIRALKNGLGSCKVEKTEP